MFDTLNVNILICSQDMIHFQYFFQMFVLTLYYNNRCYCLLYTKCVMQKKLVLPLVNSNMAFKKQYNVIKRCTQKKYLLWSHSFLQHFMSYVFLFTVFVFSTQFKGSFAQHLCRKAFALVTVCQESQICFKLFPKNVNSKKKCFFVKILTKTLINYYIHPNHQNMQQHTALKV